MNGEVEVKSTARSGSFVFGIHLLLLTGAICFSVKFVRNKRTPQLMSKPTPPGDTTAFGFDISTVSKAAQS